MQNHEKVGDVRCFKTKSTAQLSMIQLDHQRVAIKRLATGGLLDHKNVPKCHGGVDLITDSPHQ